MKDRVVIVFWVWYLLGSIMCMHSFSQEPVIVWDKVYGGDRFDWLSDMIPAIDGGILISGTSWSKSNPPYKYTSSYGGWDGYIAKIDFDGNIIWDNSFGGFYDDDLFEVIATSDDHYMLRMNSSSEATGIKSSPNIGYEDVWIIKTDQEGQLVWEKSFGTTQSDHGYSMAETPDGDFLVGCYSYGGQEGDKSDPSIGGHDFWLLKIDSDGNKIWDKTYGSLYAEYLFDIIVLKDGSAVLLGTTNVPVPDGDVSEPRYGSKDIWLLKIDPDGNKIWDKRFGGFIGDSNAETFILTQDGKLVIAGGSNGLTSAVKSDSYGDYDTWMLKIDTDGNLLWEKTFGGTGYDKATNVLEDEDHNLIIVGGSASLPGTGNKTSPHYGDIDGWVIKTDADGNKIWENSVGGGGDDFFKSVFLIDKNTFMAGGVSKSLPSGTKTAPRLGDNPSYLEDFWIVKFQVEDPLFAQFIDFDARQYNNTVRLQWETSMEINNDYFVIERSSKEHLEFISIDTIPSQNPNSYEAQTYTAIDHDPRDGYNVYRIQQRDVLGNKTYSKTAAVYFEKEETAPFVFVPNPAHLSTSLHYNTDEEVTLSIYNPLGKLVLLQPLDKNRNSFDINTTQWNTGIYFCQISSGREVLETVKLVLE